MHLMNTTKSKCQFLVTATTPGGNVVTWKSKTIKRAGENFRMVVSNAAGQYVKVEMADTWNNDIIGVWPK